MGTTTTLNNIEVN